MVEKVIVVTGASRGIGFEFVTQLLSTPMLPHPLFQTANGCDAYTVVALVRTPQQQVDAEDKWSALRDIATTINTTATTQNIPQRRLLVIGDCDVTNDDALDHVATRITNELGGRIDLLVANAGIYESAMKVSTILSNNDDNVVQQFKVNSIAPVVMVNKWMHLLQKAATPLPEKQEQEQQQKEQSHLSTAQVGFISSGMASLCKPTGQNAPTYRAAKCSLNMYIRLLAMEYNNVNFLPLHPGWVATDMGKSTGAAPVQPADSVAGLLVQLGAHCTQEESGEKLWVYDGSVLQW